MAQFDVFRNPSTTTRKHFPYLVDIQSPYLEELATRIVIPLGNASLFKDTAMKGLTPEVTFQDEHLLLLGHKELTTTMIYTQVANIGATGVPSPLDSKKSR